MNNLYKMTKQCKNCNKEFIVKGNHHYHCSKKCADKYSIESRLKNNKKLVMKKQMSRTKKYLKKYNGSYVYLIKSFDNFYTIGKCNNIKRRLIYYKTHNPVIKIIHAIKVKNNKEREKMLHKIFREYTANKEWFKIPKNKIYLFLKNCLLNK